MKYKACFLCGGRGEVAGDDDEALDHYVIYGGNGRLKRRMKRSSISAGIKRMSACRESIDEETFGESFHVYAGKNQGSRKKSASRLQPRLPAPALAIFALPGA